MLTVAPRLAPALSCVLLTVAPRLAGESAEAPIRFVDVSRRARIEFRHRCGSPEKDWIVEVNGSGVGLLDYDRDGDLDLYFVNGSTFDPVAQEAPPRNELWRNEGQWRFRDVTGEAGVGDAGWGSGVAVADLDNDGWSDLYVANFGPNVVYRNRADGTFERVPATGAEDPRWSSSACLADFDGNGLVDIYVANYLEFERDPRHQRGNPACLYKGVPIFCGPGGLRAVPDSLFLATGRLRYRDASLDGGIRSPPPGYGMGCAVLDVQRDGRPDIVVANDTTRNFCFLGRGDGTFTEAGLFLGLAYNDYGVEQAGMGLAVGDARGRGLDDVFVTNYEDDTNTLYLSDGDGLYREGTFPAGLGAPSYRSMGWSTFFLDAEGDGDLDLFVANGHLAPQLEGVPSSIGYRQANQLFLNDGSGRFRECPDCLAGEREGARSSRGAACGDLDGDGDPDIVVSNIDETPTLLENRARGRWLEVRLRGTRSNRAGIGARVRLRSGGKRQERTVRSGTGYASQNELLARFGLGGARRIESLRVRWPSGRDEEFPPPLVERRASLTLVEGRGRDLSRRP